MASSKRAAREGDHTEPKRTARPESQAAPEDASESARKRGMPDDAKIPSPFDVRTIKLLVGLMSEHDLSEIDLREGKLRIRLRRGPQDIAVQTVGQMLPAGTPATYAPGSPAPSSAPPTAGVAQPKPETPAKNLISVKSPTPGTFYAAPSPGAPPFIQVGSRVEPTTVVGVIEAMKIFNEIQAECSGVVAEICVENQQPVEYDQVLLKVDPAA
jgi:acetyl-CoA carboxylase biotin carboxyl carrier protein